MRNDRFERMLRAQELVSRQLWVSDAIAKFQDAMRFNEYIDQQRSFERIAMGPLADMRRFNLQVLDSQFRNQFASLLAAERRFITTSLSDVMKLSIEYAKVSGPTSLERYSLQLPDIQALVKSIHSPWLDVENKVRSMDGLVALHGIGSLLNMLPPFDIKLTESIRHDLGDWRKEISWPVDIATNLIARTSLYEQQGLNPHLTEFPYPAFQEITEEAGIRLPAVPAADGYDLQWWESEETDQDDAFDRTNRAHSLLHRLESQLRRFIHEKMEAMFGPDWIRQRVPGPMRERWRERQRQDIGTQKWPLIAYADFTDYEQVIVQRNNWRELFEPSFFRKSSVQESFQRLYPVRSATMHARLITEDDELYLYVETKRLLTAIGVWVAPSN